MEYIATENSVVVELERLSLYWNDNGKSIRIAVKKQQNALDSVIDSVIVITSEHWSHVEYINTGGLLPEECWESIINVARGISRTLIRCDDVPYVCITNLDRDQSLYVLNHIKREIYRISDGNPDSFRAWELNWDITDSVPPPTSTLF